MTTSHYDDKREFDRTPEPPGEALAGDVDPLTAPPGTRFVIQQHHATAFHHDVSTLKVGSRHDPEAILRAR